MHKRQLTQIYSKTGTRVSLDPGQPAMHGRHRWTRNSARFSSSFLRIPSTVSVASGNEQLLPVTGSRKSTWPDHRPSHCASARSTIFWETDTLRGAVIVTPHCGG